MIIHVFDYWRWDEQLHRSDSWQTFMTGERAPIPDDVANRRRNRSSSQLRQLHDCWLHGTRHISKQLSSEGDLYTRSCARLGEGGECSTLSEPEVVLDVVGLDFASVISTVNRTENA